MSVFSRIKRGRQAAKEHNAKQAEKQKKEEEKIPYKHIPKHAAIDALSGGPATWRESDRPKILEQNRRRSAMTANGVGMSGMMTPIHAGMPRVNSALSHVSYPSLYASPVVQMPRTYSYSSIQPGWSNHGGEVVYSHVAPTNGSIKGKEVERVMVDSGCASRSSSKAASPVGSSSNSTSSQDDLEMKPVEHDSTSTAASVSTSTAATPPTSSRPAGEVDYFHRLHPSQTRRISDTYSFNQPRGAYVSQRQGGPRVTSLPANSGGVPPVPALPQLQFGSPLSQHAASPSVGSASSGMTRNTRAPSPSTSMPDYVSRSPSLGPKSTSPARMPLPEEVAGPIPNSDLDLSLPAGIAITTPTLSHKTRRISKATRFTELETISSNIPESMVDTHVPAPAKEETVHTKVSPVASLPTEFDESVLSAPSNPTPPSTRKPAKLTKNAGSKLVKKNRWSMKGGKSTAVAV